MLTISIPKEQAIFTRLPLMAGKVRANVNMAVHKIATQLRTEVVRNKLSGQVLNKRTGHLQQSIQQQVTETAVEIQGKVFSAGDVKYAAIHEYGGTIHHPGGTAYFVDKSGQPFFVSNKFALSSDNFPRTKPHLIKMPERSYLRTTLAENKQYIIDTLTKAAIMGVKE